MSEFSCDECGPTSILFGNAWDESVFWTDCVLNWPLWWNWDLCGSLASSFGLGLYKIDLGLLGLMSVSSELNHSSLRTDGTLRCFLVEVNGQLWSPQADIESPAKDLSLLSFVQESCRRVFRFPEVCSGPPSPSGGCLSCLCIFLVSFEPTLCSRNWVWDFFWGTVRYQE